MTRVVEVRTYRLKRGVRPAFHALMEGESLPLVRAWGMDVVAFGPCREDADGYVLIRAYDDVAHLRASQEAFYGSEAWRQGPREAVLAGLEAHLSVVFALDEAGIDVLRKASLGVP
ncbi:MAG TPA: hypothetical protein VJ623_07450 [Holophagaceae bacterium]|nr:hypothetical protein [Holophagaceae bacterium]